MALMDTGLRGRRNRDENFIFPDMEKPQIIGCYSVDTNQDYEPTAKFLRYFRMPQKFPLDLNEGYGTANSRKHAESINHILQFIQHHQDELLKISNSRGVGDFDFICYRGLLRLLMCTPYELKDDWCFHATRFKGNIYLSEKETDAKKSYRLSMNEHQKLSFAYGYKFEQFCMTSNPADEPNTNQPVDECEQFFCMYKTKLQGMELLFGAEVDGVISDEIYQNIENKDVLNTLKLIELKCSIRPGNERQQQNFLRHRGRKWWCQSFLVGIKDLIVGYRNEMGLVDEVTFMKVNDLAKSATYYWTPSQCGNFLVNVLKMVKDKMKDVDCSNTVYEFYFDPKTKVISYRVYEGKSSHTILPDWYVEMLQR